MEYLRAKLMSLSIYKQLLDTDPLRCLLALTEEGAPEARIGRYTDLLHCVWQEGHNTLSDCLRHHLQYDESFFGKLVASNHASRDVAAAAERDLRVLSEIGQLSCGSIKAFLAREMDPVCRSILDTLPELPMGTPFTPEEILESYRRKGCGLFALGRAFHWEKGRLTQVKTPDAMDADAMIGYEVQRQSVVENTRILMNGLPSANVLLYGDSGTGKSATVKSLLTVPEFYNLRLIEIAKNSLDELTDLIRFVSGHTQKFILYIDDLSFSQEDKGFSALKTALEGGLERRPDNVAIYVTSNRRHMIRERFSDRQGDDVHAKETLEEHSSLAERFGLRIAYLALDKRRYTDMVLELCHRRDLPFSDEEIRQEANRWELRHGGRTPRVAVQLVEQLAGRAIPER